MAPKKTRAGSERLHLVYVDECALHTHPYLAQVWRRKGHPMKVPAAGADHKSMLYGALDYATGQVIWQHHPENGSEAFTAFLTHLQATLPPDEPVVVVLDNASYHKSRALAAVWQQHAQRLQPYFLPAYSPQLNLLERVWRYLKAKLANHRWWHELDRLQQATDALLSHLTVHFHTNEQAAFQLDQNFC